MVAESKLYKFDAICSRWAWCAAAAAAEDEAWEEAELKCPTLLVGGVSKAYIFARNSSAVCQIIGNIDQEKFTFSPLKHLRVTTDKMLSLSPLLPHRHRPRVTGRSDNIFPDRQRKRDAPSKCPQRDEDLFTCGFPKIPLDKGNFDATPYPYNAFLKNYACYVLFKITKNLNLNHHDIILFCLIFCIQSNNVSFLFKLIISMQSGISVNKKQVLGSLIKQRCLICLC